jgi:hypothetical protein
MKNFVKPHQVNLFLAGCSNLKPMCAGAGRLRLCQQAACTDKQSHSHQVALAHSQPSKPIRGLSGTLMALEESPDSAVHRNKKAHQLNQPSICTVLCILTNIVLYVHWDRFGKGHQTALRSLLHCTVGLLHSLCTGLWPLVCHHRCRTAAAAPHQFQTV